MIRKCSRKPVLSYDACIRKFHFTLPVGMADGIFGGKKCFSFGIGFNTFHLPVGEDVTIEFDQWELFRNINLPNLPRYDYDPIRGENGWYPF